MSESNRWCLTFNTSKCKRMHIGKDNPKFQYTMTTENNNIVLTETVQEKDLGVWISNNLKWEKQVVVASQQAMVVLRSVKRAFIHFDRETFNIVYNTYIRPLLEYCIQTWSPYCLKRFNKIVIPKNKFQMASGQGSHWLIESPTIFSCVACPYQISVNNV